jgi:hypothetical protein
MHSKEELAQPVGNAKIRGEFDTDAATVSPRDVDAWRHPAFTKEE